MDCKHHYPDLEEVDEFDPFIFEEHTIHEELDTDCFGNCFSDADPGL